MIMRVVCFFGLFHCVFFGDFLISTITHVISVSDNNKTNPDLVNTLVKIKNNIYTLKYPNITIWELKRAQKRTIFGIFQTFFLVCNLLQLFL